MATADEYAAWIVNNADKKGTHEFATVAAAYKDALSKGGIGQQPMISSPTEGMSGLDKFRAGMGKAFADTGRGIGQLVGLVDQKDIDEAKRLDSHLMSSGAGMAGNIIGNIATYAPLAFIPGANTIAGGGTIGAISGAIQPVGSEDSRAMNAVVGGVLGGSVPAVIRSGRTIKAAAVDPFTEAGRTRIAGGVLNRSAANPEEAASALQNAMGATPGFNPSVAQATGDAGLSALERTVRAVEPKAWAALDSSQRAALADSVRNLAGNPTARQAAIDARENAVKALYETAKKRVVVGDSDLEAILQRPTVSAGLSKAEKIAADEGRKFQLTQGRPAQTVNSGVLDSQGNQIKNTIPATPATYLGQGLHDLKLGIDDAISEGSSGFGNRVTGSQLSAKEAFVNWLEQHVPEYGAAKSQYIQLSKPINQMDIGQNFAERFIPALYRDMPAPAQLNSSALAKALTDQGDDIARQVTGMKGAKLDKILTHDQLQSLKAVIADSQAVKAAENVGRGVGSDTVQKTSMSHLAAEAGIPNWIASVARVPGGWAKRAGDVFYGNADEAVRLKLAQLLQNPQEAAQAMNATRTTSSTLAEILKKIPLMAAQASVPMLTAQ